MTTEWWVLIPHTVFVVLSTPGWSGLSREESN